uniref:helix-turn-helix domain-containing protein n=1 Tax=Evtepia gabavorous TaxID=2211183 RepID=UPI003AEFB8C5
HVYGSSLCPSALQGFVYRRCVPSSVLQGKFIELTPMEFDVFHLLARRPGRVFSQRELYEFAAPDSFDSSWTGISSIIYKLRHKLNADFIQTVYGKGYKFLPP